jgi:hypothetical protein
MKNFPSIPKDPAELASIRAEEDFDDRSMTPSTADVRRVEELEHAAEILGFTGNRYLASAARGILLPTELDAYEQVPYTDYYGITLKVHS